MSAQSLLTRILTATTRLLPGQSQTLAVLVAAALRCERPNLAQVGRGLRASVGSPNGTSLSVTVYAIGV